MQTALSQFFTYRRGQAGKVKFKRSLGVSGMFYSVDSILPRIYIFSFLN